MTLSPRQAATAFWAATALWALAWLLPACRDFWGWQCFQLAALQLSTISGQPLSVLRAISPWTNALVPALLWLGRSTASARRHTLFVVLFASSFFVNLVWLLDDETRDVKAGYFLWIASFAIFATILVMRDFNTREQALFVQRPNEGAVAEPQLAAKYISLLIFLALIALPIRVLVVGHLERQAREREEAQVAALSAQILGRFAAVATDNEGVLDSAYDEAQSSVLELPADDQARLLAEISTLHEERKAPFVEARRLAAAEEAARRHFAEAWRVAEIETRAVAAASGHSAPRQRVPEDQEPTESEMNDAIRRSTLIGAMGARVEKLGSCRRLAPNDYRCRYRWMSVNWGNFWQEGGLWHFQIDN